jgi:hypothetical protein
MIPTGVGVRRRPVRSPDGPSPRHGHHERGHPAPRFRCAPGVGEAPALGYREIRRDLLVSLPGLWPREDRGDGPSCAALVAAPVHACSAVSRVDGRAGPPADDRRRARNWQLPFHRHFDPWNVKGEWFAYTWVMQRFLAEQGITGLPRPPKWTPEMVPRMVREFEGTA